MTARIEAGTPVRAGEAPDRHDEAAGEQKDSEEIVQARQTEDEPDAAREHKNKGY
jgi:hypothetical protein